MDNPQDKTKRGLVRRLVDPLSRFLPASLAKPRAGVLIHDPAAEGPQNLDDPFLDAQAQKRIGELIAKAAAKGGPPKSE